MKTISKYGYYESGNGEWIKAIITVPNIKKVKKEDINVVFGERTLDVFVKNYGEKGDEILHFGCRKLQSYVNVKESKWSVKSDGVGVSLKKRSKKDNWWSFFKTKATMERPSESSEDDQE